ncbi:MAG: alpha-ketoacid dehydrogenase subunit beta [Alphaproteobacteria bacterium]|nr:alpha-ketoacid dehydrogenase subunit beta [Alphaproteobacteria bacterium]
MNISPTNLSPISSEIMPARMSYREALAAAMREALTRHDHTVIIGQGATDFKGIFGTITGLHREFPGRVIETPLSEDAATGVCIGAALNGLYPINTHIRADFGLLAINQLVNMAAKQKYMFGGLFSVPMMVRLVIGRSWGQGAQHSQSLQSLFAHIPGLVVLMPSTPESIVRSYAHAVAHHAGPVLVLEHRLMYELVFDTAMHPPVTNPFGSHIQRVGKDVTIVATSIMVLEALRASANLARYGIDCEIIDLHSISHPDREMIMTSVAKTGKLLVADTSWLAYGVAAEVCRIVAESDPGVLKAPVVTLGMAPAPCPTAKALEDLYYPNLRDLMSAIVRLVRGADDPAIEMPSEHSMSDFYKKFRGPF